MIAAGPRPEDNGTDLRRSRHGMCSAIHNCSRNYPPPCRYCGVLVGWVRHCRSVKKTSLNPAGVVPHPRTQPAGDHERLEGTLRGPGVEHEGSVEFDRGLVKPHRCEVLDDAVIHDCQDASYCEEARRSDGETAVAGG